MICCLVPVTALFPALSFRLAYINRTRRQCLPLSLLCEEVTSSTPFSALWTLLDWPTVYHNYEPDVYCIANGTACPYIFGGIRPDVMLK